MGENAEKASIIIPAYNSADYTVETVESVLGQTYSNKEIIVVDDGSQDHTRQALEPYAGRLTYVYKENGGACSARNMGIGMATGAFVACLDCDDLWLPEKLEHSIDALNHHPEWAFVCSSCYTIDARGEIVDTIGYSIDLSRAYYQLLHENYVLAPTVVMRHSCLQKVGLFDESIFIPADWDLWLRLARRFPIGYLDRPLSKYRLASNYTIRNIEQHVREAKYVIEKQLAEESGLNAKDHMRIMSRLFYSFALLYGKADDGQKMREMLRRAISAHPLFWRPYAYYMRKLLGGFLPNRKSNSDS